MELRVNTKLNCAANDAWKLLTDSNLYAQWYGAAVEEALFQEGGFIRFAPFNGSQSFQAAITDFAEGESLTVSGGWFDEKYRLIPLTDGCIIEKQFLLQNGIDYPPEEVKNQERMHYSQLCAFERLADRIFSPVAPPFAPVPSKAEPVAAPAKKKHGKTVDIVLASVFLVLAAVGAVLFFTLLRPYLKEQDKIKQYNRGAEAIEKGDYEKAAEIFRKLGNYDDSAKLLAYAKKGIIYESGKKEQEKGNYRDAKEILSEVADFKDTAELIGKCDREIAYDDAVSLAEAGRYEEALNKLSEAGDRVDDRGIAKLCREARVQEQIRSLMDAQKYQEALDLLQTEEGQTVDDREELLKTCEKGVAYEEALALFRDERYYSAYNKFKALGNFENAASYANSCAQNTPATKELYKNNAYSGTGVTLKIMPPTNDGNYNYVKLYIVSGNEEILVRSIFIQKGGNCTVKIPAGKYVIKVAYGSGTWYGEKEMFGSAAVYERLKSTETSEIFALNNNYTYTLKLRTEQNGNVRTSNENRDKF